MRGNYNIVLYHYIMLYSGILQLVVLEKKLVSEKEGKAFAKKIVMFQDVERMRVLSNPVAWRMMELLSKGPMYPAQVAKELKIYEQSAYYYIRKLVKIGAVDEVGRNFVRGGTARLYRAASPSFGIEMDWGETRIDRSRLGTNRAHPNSLKILFQVVSSEVVWSLVRQTRMDHTNHQQEMVIMPCTLHFSLGTLLAQFLRSLL